MSFQGDVGGIGLAELLQSLASGRREGVLTLTGSDGLYSTLGLQSGQIHFLPNPDEDADIWRQRAARAWADQTEPRVDHLRMSEIARSRRIENLYKLLDSQGVHFRFQPGALPEPPSDPTVNDPTRNQTEAVFCGSAPVEYLLFEYARLGDEGGGVGAEFVDPGLVLKVLQPGELESDAAALHAECQVGTSDLSEIADRLSWPERQVRNEAAKLLHAGILRVSSPPELLAQVRQELERMQIERAAARLASWIRFSPPGPMGDADANLIMAEWNSGRLQKLLHELPSRVGRRLLRRLQAGRLEPRFCVPQWSELHRIHGKDRIVELRILALEVHDGEDPDRPSIRQLLNMARWMRESKQTQRAAVILKIAAERAPSTAGARLEVGNGMLAAGLEEEGLPWLLDGALQLMEQGQFEKAVPPLRTVLDLQPRHREARRLYSRARSQTIRRQMVKKHSLLGFALLIIFSGIAYVQRKNERQREEHMAEVSEHIGDPEEAARLLDLYFEGEQDADIISLRATIEERRRSLDTAARAAWNDRYRETQIELTLGDPVLGLERAFELPAPPELLVSQEPFPLRSDLYDGLAARFESDLNSLGDILDDEAQEERESKFATQVERVLELTRERNEAEHLETLNLRLDAVRRSVIERGHTREKDRREAQIAQVMNAQDRLLATARSRANAKDFERALIAYDELLATDEGGQLAQLGSLRGEISEVREKWEAIQRARGLAERGRHEEALELMNEKLEEPGRHSLPWTVNSFPPGALVRMPSGETRTTPFTIESPVGRAMALNFELEGHESVQVQVDGPGDLDVMLSLVPEFAMETSTRFEAPPLMVDGDAVCVDRSGRVFRASLDGEVIWEKSVGKLGGISRAPVRLGQDGDLLMLTESGEAWLFDPEDGEAQGPAGLDSPPHAGPVASGDAVYAGLLDGRVARWTSGVQPSFGEWEDELYGADGSKPTYGDDAGLAILRRQDSSRELTSPSGQLRVVLEDDRYAVYADGGAEPDVLVLRKAPLQFVAFDSTATGERLWISDGAGLRAFRP